MNMLAPNDRLAKINLSPEIQTFDATEMLITPSQLQDRHFRIFLLIGVRHATASNSDV
jgi:hypothetical protein